MNALTIRMFLILVAAIPGAGLGCQSQPSGNSSFPLTLSAARDALLDMKHDPKMPDRPIVVLGGIYDPGLVASTLARRLRQYTHPDAVIIHVTFFATLTFDQCRDRVLDKIQKQLPSNDSPLMTEVDVVAVSMGGLVARYAALSTSEDPRILRIRRLYTLSTPHRGAALARISPFDKRAHDMRPGSDFLSLLDAALPDCGYEIIPYTRLNDAIVGEENAAPPGRIPWWVTTPSFQFAHLTAFSDPRLLADIARRLRGESPFTIDPPHPLPSSVQK